MSNVQDTFDPTAPEGDTTARGAYVSRKDIKVIIFGMAFLAAILTPVYMFMLKNTEKARCSQNMKAMIDSMNLYANEHDGRFPPLARTEAYESNVPTLGESGYVYTWASDIAGYMNPRASFKCPSAKPEEIVLSEDPKTGKSFPLTYGMYAPYSGLLTSLVENPDQSILLAESVNMGAAETFDPVPFKNAQGTPLPDGYMLGWSDSNNGPTASSKSITRLAFLGTKDGKFDAKGESRHSAGIHMLTVTGERLLMKPDSALLKLPGKSGPNPFWRIPAGAKVSQ